MSRGNGINDGLAALESRDFGRRWRGNPVDDEAPFSARSDCYQKPSLAGVSISTEYLGYGVKDLGSYQRRRQLGGLSPHVARFQSCAKQKVWKPTSEWKQD